MIRFCKILSTLMICLTLYVSINGGPPIRAQPFASGGRMVLEYTENGVKKKYETPIDVGTANIFGGLTMFWYVFIYEQSVVNFTYPITQ